MLLICRDFLLISNLYVWVLCYQKEGNALINMFVLCPARDAYFSGDELSYNDCYMYGEAPKKDFNINSEIAYCDYIAECYGYGEHCNYYDNEEDIETFRGIRINDTIDKIFERYGKQEVLNKEDDLMMAINNQFESAIRDTSKVIKLCFYSDEIDFTLRFFIGNDNKVKVIGYFLGEKNFLDIYKYQMGDENMKKYTAQEKYDAACIAYDDFIKELCVIGNELKIDSKALILDFDIILQYILLVEAMSDGKFLNLEKEFIEKITREGNLLDLIRYALDLKEKISWDIFSDLSDERTIKFLSIVKDIVEKKTDDFIGTMLLYNVMDRTSNIKNAMINTINKISIALADIDGNIQNDELKVSENFTIDLICKRWDDKVKDAEKYLQKRLDFLKEGKKVINENRINELINTPSDKLTNYLTNRTRMKSCIIYIESKSGSGTGFIISKNGYAITCAHVVDDMDDLKVKLVDENDYTKIVDAKTIYFDENLDLAIIKIDCDLLNYSELDLDRFNVDIGDEVALFGYPLGRTLNSDISNLNMSFVKGYVSSRQIEGGIKRTMLDISAMPGYSGGPIINLNTGKVVGVLAGAVGSKNGKEPYKISYMIPIEYFKSLFE